MDLDLEKFFDNVPHDRLLRMVSDVVKDGNVVSLVNKFLKAGVMIQGNYEDTVIGTPQGGPLSLLLSNIMLNKFDKELEARGLAFCRRGYMFVAHSKILQNAITKIALSKPNKKKGRRGLVFALDYYLA